MTDLIKRLEEAEAGSRELDALLARRFGWHRVEPRHMRGKGGGWIAPEDFMGVNSDGSPRLDSLRGTDIHRDPPRLSQSIDAALALAERVISQRGPIELSICGSAQAVIHHNDPCGNPLAMVYGNTPALALCIAVLKAADTGREG
jgi:hypothetical protein